MEQTAYEGIRLIASPPWLLPWVVAFALVGVIVAGIGVVAAVRWVWREVGGQDNAGIERTMKPHKEDGNV